MATKKILLCGATGFIGRNLLETLSLLPQYQVYAVTHQRKPPQALLHYSNIEWLQADLTNQEDVQKITQEMDIVIQAAATTSGAKEIIHKPYYHVTDNAVMNSLLLQASYESRVKHFVFFSCTVMYPEQAKPVLEEDFNYQITDKYFGVGWTKVYIEKMCEFYSKISSTKFSVIRHSNVYGPHDKYDLEKSHVFGATVTKVMTAQENFVTVWGDGSEARDLLYIEDLTRFVLLILEQQKTPFELINIGSGCVISVKDLVQKIIKKSGKPLDIRFDRTKPTLPYKLCVDTTKALKIYGWQPRITLDEGIEKTLQWYRENY